MNNPIKIILEKLHDNLNHRFLNILKNRRCPRCYSYLIENQRKDKLYCSSESCDFIATHNRVAKEIIRISNITKNKQGERSFRRKRKKYLAREAIKEDYRYRRLEKRREYIRKKRVEIQKKQEEKDNLSTNTMS